jgi:transposase InsO family protein
LAGPIEPTAKDGFKYALSFVDDFTGINMVYFLKQKSDTTEATEKYIADVAPYGKIKRLRSDNGGEFISYRFKSLLRLKKARNQARDKCAVLTASERYSRKSMGKFV